MRRVEIECDLCGRVHTEEHFGTRVVRLHLGDLGCVGEWHVCSEIGRPMSECDRALIDGVEALVRGMKSKAIELAEAGEGKAG